MKSEKNFKEAWKKELETVIYLRSELKEGLIEKVTSRKGENTTSGKWMYPIILTTFAFGVAFFLMITIQSNPYDFTESSTQAANTFLGTGKLVLTEKFYWVIGTVLLEMITVILFFATLKKTRRWQSNKKIRVFKKLLSTKIRNFLIQGFCVILLGSAVVYLASIVTLNTFQIYTSFIMAVFNCLLMLFSIRKLNKTTCPHCGHHFSRKELLKMTWAPFQLKCIRCERNVYLSHGAKNKSYLFISIPFICHYGLGFLGIPFPIIIFSFLLVGLFFNFYIINFTTSFSKKDEPLW